MSASRQVWLLAADDAPWRMALTGQLASHGMQVETVPRGEIAGWRAAGAIPAVHGYPQLLVIPMEAAQAEDWGLLRLLDRAGVWRCLPRVVVATDDDRACVSACHALGVASVVTLPDGPAQQAAGQFARYWARTALLPSAEYLVS